MVNGRDVRSNVISSQIALHTLYGGVVPEIASRKHIEKINQVIEQALSDASVTLDDIDAIGVTYGPGLVGALLVGVAEAKAISYAKNIPLVGVHHIEGHISANYIENKELEPPFLCLVVSGGHTHLVKVLDYGKYEILSNKRSKAVRHSPDGLAALIGKDRSGDGNCYFARPSFFSRFHARMTCTLVTRLPGVKAPSPMSGSSPDSTTQRAALAVSGGALWARAGSSIAVSAMLSARTMLMSRFCIRFSPSQAPSKPGAFVVPSVPRFARFGRFWARIAPQMR